jgi:hypothetical protein
VTLLYAEDLQIFEKLLIFHSKEISERCQIFCIRQKNSYSRLYLSQEAFEQLLLAYSIFSRIWDFALQFNSKTRESDIGHAPFRFRQLDPVLLDGCLGSYGIVPIILDLFSYHETDREQNVSMAFVMWF